MSSLLFALVGSFLAGFGARDQLLVAQLRARLGPSPALLMVAVLSACVTSAVAAWAGGWMAQRMSGSAETMLVAIALLLAAVDLGWPRRAPKAPVEPTRSLTAALIVLLARQVGDAPRFLVFALAAATASPLLAGIGGALGGSAAVAMGWAMGDDLERQLPLRPIRWALAAVVLMLAIYLGLTARGIVG